MKLSTCLVKGVSRRWKGFSTSVGHENFVLGKPTWSLAELNLSAPEQNMAHAEILSRDKLSKLSKLALIDLSQQSEGTVTELSQDVDIVLRCATQLGRFSKSEGKGVGTQSAEGQALMQPLRANALRDDNILQEHSQAKELFRNSSRVHGDFFVAPKE